MASITERNARLDALAEATKQYAAQQRKLLKKRVDVSKRILQGRTGSERLAQASVQESSSLVATEIDDFLVG